MLLAENIAEADVNTQESNLAPPVDSAADRILEVLLPPWRRRMPVRSTDRNLDIAAAAVVVENIPDLLSHLVDPQVDNWDMQQFPRRKISSRHRYIQRREDNATSYHTLLLHRPSSVVRRVWRNRRSYRISESYSPGRH